MNVPVVPSLEAAPKFARKIEPLTSWKQIAGYLGMGVRTVQRYEREHAMPVLRFEGRGHAAVWAYPAELDTWLRAKIIKEQRPSSHDSNLNVDAEMSQLTVAMAKISQSLAENQRLRKEASRLRTEMKESVALLSTGLRTFSCQKARTKQE